VSDNVQTAGEQIRAFLKSEGIVVPGKVRDGKLTKDATLVYELESYPLSKIVEGLNQFSNNYVADVLIKRLGAAFPKSGVPDAAGQGNYENGMAVVSSFLKNDVGIKDSFVMKNGSGLSTENRLSADQLSKILTYVAGGLDVFPEFLASLPASGLNGTLEKRFDAKNTLLLRGKVRAKTGTLSEPISVSSLAGYVHHPVHGLLAFAIMQNGIEGKKQPGIDILREVQDRAVADFLKFL
jgi:D-alanyl-D-alanine carboxypeptidase/D-alanyl-D-alanine-endopeptidase (penicillin-binding protein 4)